MSIYTPTVWKNGSPPAINGANLNKMEAGIQSAHAELDDVVSGVTKVAKAAHAEAADLATKATEADSSGPVGTIINFGGAAVPTGYLECAGQTVSQTVYAALFAAIGTLWDTAGGAAAPAAGTFRLPPQAVDGFGVYMGGKSSVIVGTYQADEIEAHEHALPHNSAGYGGHLPFDGGGGYPDSGYVSDNKQYSSTNEFGGTETRPHSITTLLCIKF